MTISVGDLVYIRGDLRINYDGRCAYTPDQLIDGIYIKHAYRDEAWAGVVKKIAGDRALVGGGWGNLEIYVKVPE